MSGAIFRVRAPFLISYSSLPFLTLSPDSLLDKSQLDAVFKGQERKKFVCLDPRLGICYLPKTAGPQGYFEEPISLAKVENLVAIYVNYTEHEDFFYDVELNFRRPICCEFACSFYGEFEF